MSFLASHQRGYDPLAHPDLSHPSLHSSHHPRHPINPLSPLHELSLPSPSSVLSATMPTTNTSHSSDRVPGRFPKPGQTRCYWALLTADLNFVYLDPVLASHLGAQADALISKSLLTYVHPEEQESAKADLGAVLESRTLHGSVTRVRYSRLRRVRRLLGYAGQDPDWQDAERVAIDENYLAIDIVINYAADGLVLCFMHAADDLTPRDNDEHHKTCWTNWCGTPSMNVEQAQLLYHRLRTYISVPRESSRIFQILFNEPNRPLCLSWPDRPGGPSSKDFARLAEDVQISNSGTDAKTTCTRRYKALQLMDFGMNEKREVESIFIPHGAIIFACHKISSVPRQNGVGGSNMPMTYQSHSYAPQGSHPYYDASAHSSQSFAPTVSTQSPYSFNPQQQMTSQYVATEWSQVPESAASHQYNQWASGSLPSDSVNGMRPSSYSTTQAPQHWAQTQYIDTTPHVPSMSQQPPSPSMQYPSPPKVEDQKASPPAEDVVPAPRAGRRSSREQYGNGGRSAGNPPVGVTSCSSCKVTHSPEWRKGPSGKKDLCNACGLRFARSRAKKEGTMGSSAQRRRKDRALSTMSGMSGESKPSPTGSPVSATYPNLGRRGSYFESDSSFLSTSSAGSGSGSEPFPQATTASAFEGLTPSPSPPSGGLNYVPSHVNYNPPMQAESRQGYNGAANSQFYSLPPPLPSQSLHHMAPNGHHGLHNRLEHVVPFPSRLSPLVTPSSALPDSPLSASFPSASYERERRDGREEHHFMLPPTPISAQPYRKPSYLSASRDGSF